MALIAFWASFRVCASQTVCPILLMPDDKIRNKRDVVDQQPGFWCRDHTCLTLHQDGRTISAAFLRGPIAVRCQTLRPDTD